MSAENENRSHPSVLPAPSRAAPASAIDLGRVEGGRVTFDNWKGEADKPAPAPFAPLPPERRVGFAVLGLGRLALEEILPAFAGCAAARPVALISGSPDKARAVAAQYGIAGERVYGYDDWERIAADPAIEAVYVVSPNGLHRDHVLAAAAAGKHVLCEKPMANTSAEAREMVEACAKAGVKLMIAYRCQYEPFNRRAIALLRSGRHGTARIIEACNTQVQGPADQWRLKGGSAGGGALPDIGLYCLNGVRAYTGEEPVEVYAQTWNPPGDVRFAEVEDTIAFQLRFPSGTIALCSASYTAHETKDMRLRLGGAFLEIGNAFAYRGQSLRLSRRSGEDEIVEEVRLAHGNAFTLEIDHFAECVRTGRVPRTPGEEGLQDHLLMEAIYRSARDNRPVSVPRVEGPDAFRGPALED